MKRKIIFVLLFFITFIMFINTVSFATFEITDFIINAKLLENGDLYVIESINYYSDENDNGVTRKIITKNPRNKTNSADSLDLYNVIVDGKFYNMTSGGSIGDEGVFEYNTNGNNEYNIKVYTPFRSKTKITYYEYNENNELVPVIKEVTNSFGGSCNKIVQYEYVLKNVGVVYNDIAELYWNFIGDEWDCKINNLIINIELPETAAYSTSYVFGHGSDNGRFEKNGNYISLYVENIDEYQPIDARILFSKNAISNSIKRVEKNVLENYINKEEGLSSKIEDKKIIANLSLKEIVIVFSSIVIVCIVWAYLKYDKENKTEKYRYFREKPFNLEPEILQYFYFGKILSNSYYIAVLNLVKLGVFKLESSINKVGREVQTLVYNKKHNANLKEYQKDIEKNIINKMEDDENGNKSIELSKLGSKLSSSSGKGYKKYIENLKAEKESLVGMAKKVPKKVKLLPVILLICLMLLVACLGITTQNFEVLPSIFLMVIISAVYPVFFINVGNLIPVWIFLLFHCGVFQGALLGMLSSGGLGLLYIPYLLIFIFIIYVWKIEKFSKEENEIKEKVRGLRRYIKDYSMLEDKDNIEYINLWEDYFILAIALKLNKKTINYFYDYGKQQINSNLGSSMYTTNNYMNFHYGLNNTFYRYAISSSSSGSSGSSYSGSSGGFSGGSSSGGGGGRRWRRRTLLKVKL